MPGESPTPDSPSVEGNLALALPEEEPRERLLCRGAQVLSDAELLSVLLGLGRPDPSVTDLAREVLHEQGSLAAFIGATPSPFGIEGWMTSRSGPSWRISSWPAVWCEARCRSGRRSPPLGRSRSTSGFVTACETRRWSAPSGVDGRLRLIAEREVYRGTFSRATVEPREILKEALLRGAAGVIVFRTRPSGDPTPGPEDRAFLRRMAAAGEVLGVEVIDHLIVGGTQEWASLRKRKG